MKTPTKPPRDRASFCHDDESSLGLDNDIINATVTAAAWARPIIDATDVTTANATDAVDAVAVTAITATASSGSDSSYDIRYNIARSYSDDDSYSFSSGDSSSGSSSGYGFTNNNRQANRNTIDDATSIFSSPPEELTPHELAAQVAQRVASRFYKNLPPKLAEDYSTKDCVAPFNVKEIVLGKLLGSGEFSHVYEIKSFMLEKDVAKNDNDNNNDNDNDNDDDDIMTKNSYTPEQIKTRKHMKCREHYHTTKKSCYAVKHLRPKLVDDYTKLDYAQSASDLANEAEFLSSLQHPNILKLRGISSSGAQGFENGPKGYFLIIDRLNETLDGRIKRWKKMRRRRNRLASGWKTKLDAKKNEAKMLLKHQLSSSFTSKEKEGGGGGGGEDATGSNDATAIGNIGDSSSTKDQKRQQQRRDRNLLINEDQMYVGLQIASALMYLHDKSIMFRDLKPQNIGFDVRGDVKIFDFGLATVMPIFGDPYENTYRMSGAGSARYMAPEVLVDPPDEYNLKAEVFTFGIVLWEMFSMKLPYSHIRKRDALVEFVVDQDGRPPINEQWPEPIKEALRLSFDADMEQRPSIQIFYNMLRLELLGLRDGDDTELSDEFIRRRRSFGSMNHLECNDAANADHGEGQQHPSQEKFRNRVKNTIMSHVKSSPTSTTNNTTGDEHAPRRRRRDRLREKFRMSMKSEENDKT